MAERSNDSSKADLPAVENLTRKEQADIFKQFHSSNWIEDGQVMWSGVPKAQAQQWAKRHGLQTLTDAMGPLMRPEDPSSPRSEKGKKQWSTYMKGASALFAARVAEGHKTVVLARPPPQKFHPSGLTNYQRIEEPILKGEYNDVGADKIEMAHPTVHGAEEDLYQVWPKDETKKWSKKHGDKPRDRRPWRAVKK